MAEVIRLPGFGKCIICGRPYPSACFVWVKGELVREFVCADCYQWQARVIPDPQLVALEGR